MIILISSLIGLLYILLMLFYVKGIRRLERPKIITENHIAISVIIPFRNEEKNLPETLISLQNQDYPNELVEFIFVNDHSIDKSENLVKNQLSSHFNIKLLSLKKGFTGKKQALILGVQTAKSEYVLVTDADCVHPKKWVSNFSHYFQKYDSDLIAAPVINSNKNSWLTYFQYIEQLSLMYVSAGSFGLNSPIMCNGANLAFKKSNFMNEIAQLELALSSGDDMFLLLSLKKKNKKLHYCTTKESIVSTKSPDTFLSFWNQRKRWASKSTKYKDALLITSSIVIYTNSLIILTLLVLTAFNPKYFILFTGLLISKSLIDLVLFAAGNSLIKTTVKDKLALIAFQIPYIFYSSVIAPFAIFGRFEWKERKLNT